MKQFSQLLTLSVLAACLTGCPETAEQSAETSPTPAASAETTTTQASAAASAVAPVAAGDPSKGPALMAAKTCGTCHTIKGVAGLTGTIGPALDGIGTRAATRVKGLDADAYLRQSIEKPNDFLVPNYQALMPALRTTLSDQEYADLIAYLLSLKS